MAILNGIPVTIIPFLFIVSANICTCHAQKVIGLSPTEKTNYTADPLAVCIHNTPPLVECNPNMNQSTYSGHDTEMFRLAAAMIGLNEGVQYNFNCTNFENIIPELEKSNSYCDIGLGGLVVTAERISAGVKNSYPYYSSALAIVVKSEITSTNGWAWIKPFATSLWIAVILTMLVYPLLVFLVEFLALKRRVYVSDLQLGMEEAAYRSMWTLLGGETTEVSTLGARIVVCCFAFMCLILSSTYTANLAAVLTVRQAKTTITSMSDLRGTAVATNAIYTSVLRSEYGVVATSNYTLDDAEGLQTAFEDVYDGALVAVVTKETAAKTVYQNYDGCQLKVLPVTYHGFDYALLFSISVNNELVGNFSGAILRMQEEGDLERLKNQFVPKEDKCDQLVSGTNMSTEFADVYGLWIIVAAGFVVACFIMLLTRRKLRKRGVWNNTQTSQHSNGSTDGSASTGSGSTPDLLYQTSKPFISGPAHVSQTSTTTEDGKMTSFLRFNRKKSRATTGGISSKQQRKAAAAAAAAAKSTKKSRFGGSMPTILDDEATDGVNGRGQTQQGRELDDDDGGGGLDSSSQYVSIDMDTFDTNANTSQQLQQQTSAAGANQAPAGSSQPGIYHKRSALQTRSSITGEQTVWHAKEDRGGDGSSGV